MFLLAPILVPIVNIVLAKGLPYGVMKYSKFQIAVSIILCVLLIVSHAKVVMENWLYYVKWIVIAVIVGVALGSVIGLVYSHYQTRGQMHATIMLVFINFITQLSSAASLEEPLFRGFIWGFLEHKGWKQVWIWLLQAALFCFAHLYYLPQYPVFFFGAFVSALVFGLLVWKSKSIGTSMIAHGLENSVADVVMHCII
jgi:membrane protease YdiL (CAAX protease family)